MWKCGRLCDYLMLSKITLKNRIGDDHPCKFRKIVDTYGNIVNIKNSTSFLFSQNQTIDRNMFEVVLHRFRVAQGD